MRVLVVTNRWPSPDAPGDSPAIEEQVRAIRGRGHLVDVLVINTRSSRFDYPRAAWKVFWRVGLLASYDLVHAHYGAFVGWVARCQWRRPVVVTFRGSDLMRSSEARISRPLLRVIDAAIVMSAQMKDLAGRPDAHIIPSTPGGDIEKEIRPAQSLRKRLSSKLRSRLNV